jgi:hypothetical protein
MAIAMYSVNMTKAMQQSSRDPMSEDEKQAIEDYFKNRGLFNRLKRQSFGPDIEARLDVNTIGRPHGYHGI